MLIGGETQINSVTVPSNITTIVHLANKTMNCNLVPDVPRIVFFAQGTIWANGSLHICGGDLSYTSVVMFEDCFVLANNSWQQAMPLRETR